MAHNQPAKTSMAFPKKETPSEMQTLARRQLKTTQKGESSSPRASSETAPAAGFANAGNDDSKKTGIPVNEDEPICREFAN
ncbi:MAG: hypothetical protein CBC13_01235 [Planctomycetia bacterium TMED53]|nr:MAG: hypothetical protein CBC13_01235 [Planctomycetia bacterium TMED53]